MNIRPLYPEIDTPALVVDLDVLERNVASMADLSRRHGIALRPHTKTHKIPAIARMQLDAGAAGITVAKLEEAEVMAAAGMRDILIANEVIGPLKMTRITALLAAFSDLRLTIAVDSVEGAAELSDAGVKAGKTIPVLIEIDTGLGRAGLPTPEEVVSLARHIRLFPGISHQGIVTHEGHVGRDGPLGMKERSALAADQMRLAADALRSIGLQCDVLSMGSTPSARFIAVEPGITELRPGTYIFNDRTQVALGAATEHDCALTVLSTVVSTRPGLRAILDAGTKSLSSDGLPRFGTYGAILGDANAYFSACSEEHGHLDISRSERDYAVGDRVHALPNHICPVVNLSNRVYGCRGEVVEVEWRVDARGCVR